MRSCFEVLGGREFRGTLFNPQTALVGRRLASCTFPELRHGLAGKGAGPGGLGPSRGGCPLVYSQDSLPALPGGPGAPGSGSG